MMGVVSRPCKSVRSMPESATLLVDVHLDCFHFKLQRGILIDNHRDAGVGHAQNIARTLNKLAWAHLSCGRVPSLPRML